MKESTAASTDDLRSGKCEARSFTPETRYVQGEEEEEAQTEAGEGEEVREEETEGEEEDREGAKPK